jgi:hypothetical protein
MIQTDPINRNMEIISCITLNAGILNLISSGDLPGFNNSGFYIPAYPGNGKD